MKMVGAMMMKTRKEWRKNKVAEIKKVLEGSENEMFEEMYKGSWYTITGAGGDLQEWVTGYEGILEERNVGKPKEWRTYSGEQMNKYYHLTGKNVYPNDLTFLSFSLEGLNTPALAVIKLMQGDRWFDDIVDNNKEREEMF